MPKSTCDSPTNTSIVALVVYPAFASTLAEHLYHTLHVQGLRDLPLGARLLTWGPYVTVCLFLSPLVWSVARSSSDARWSAIAGLLVALAVIHAFRGPIYWPGIFDRAGESKAHLFGPFLGASLVGGVAAMAGARPIRDWSLISSIAGLAAIGWSFFHLRAERGLDSSFAYSRHLSTGVLMAILLFAHVWTRVEEHAKQ